jgi:hypothetical protein
LKGVLEKILAFCARFRQPVRKKRALMISL